MNIIVIPSEQTPRVPEIKDVKLFLTENINELQEFKNFAQIRNDAVGLAANQVSINDYRFMARVFALRNLKENTWRLIIDPVITEYIGIKDIKCEGCLTWKNKKIVAERSRAIRVNYYNEEGKKIIGEIYRGFEAQIWQHEINHLNGIEEQVEDIDYNEPKPIEVGRNELCPCGSGKKYKNCCIII